jgi:hypothetical protein
MALPAVINSPVLRSFLLSGPITLSPAEQADSQRRLEADAVREEGRRRFKLEAERRVEGLREGLAQFKGELLNKKGGLKNVFEVVRRIERVEDLPRAEASVLEWGRISSVIQRSMIPLTDQTRCDCLSALCGFRYRFRYPYISQASSWPHAVLRAQGDSQDLQPNGHDQRYICLHLCFNPLMLLGVLELFLARPFGGQSLIQRLVSMSVVRHELTGQDVFLFADRGCARADGRHHGCSRKD